MLSIDIDGTAFHPSGGAGSYDRVVVQNEFVANGAWAPILRGITGAASNSFNPSYGDSFTIVVAGRVRGGFSSFI